LRRCSAAYRHRCRRSNTLSNVPSRLHPCTGCGAKLEFAPGTSSLKCPYCGAENEISIGSADERAQALKHLDFLAYLKDKAGNEPQLERQTVRCPGCGAAVQLPPNVTADRCPFCAGPLVAAQAYAHRTIAPHALAPFVIRESAARSSFKQWLSGLWLAPNALKQAAHAETGIKGVYLPYWTYDANSQSPYTGERGVVYYEQERYTEDGREKVRQVERVRWSPAAGQVSVQFADVLVPASMSVPGNFIRGLAPWRLDLLTPYRDDFVTGFTVEAYQTGLEPGFGIAQQQMEADIRTAICRDIGGDRQRILSMAPRYFDIAFKHILLPIWLSCYRYADKTYRFVVNGQTGAVQGERPWSAWKIAGAVLAAIVLVIVVAALKHHH
jgi:LSD1 subclass zinc finger protein